MKKPIVGLIALAVLTGIYLYTHVDFNTQNTGELPPVSIANVKQENVSVPLQEIGTVQPYLHVAVVPQVSGELIKKNFKEGEMVSAGQVLFQIDPRSFQATLDTAQANLARDQATFLNNKLTYERYRKIFNKKYLSAQDLDQAKANLDSTAAVVKADQAAVDNAKLQLSYCTIIAPIAGRAGNVLIDVGNIITAQQATATLTTINQVQPIYVAFSIPEKDLPVIKKVIAQKNAPITATINNKISEPGQLTFIDNNIDNTTGTILIKGTFANNDLQLWPGQFVRVTLPTEKLNNALVIPQLAVQQGQSNPFVYVVGKKNIVHYQAIVTGPTVADGIVVTQGLTAGEKVVISGQLRLTDGTKVEIEKAS